MKQKRAGFTLADLVFSIAIGVLLVLIFSVFTGHQHREKGSCSMNISSIGKGFAMYANANNDIYPFMAAKPGWDAVKTGTHRTNAPDPTMERSVTSLLFMLVRDGQSAKYFLCPSQNSTVECTNIKDTTSGKYYWDFEDKTNLSYAYQTPLADNTNGVSTKADTGSTIILADSPPPDAVLTKWAAGENPLKYLSTNHVDYFNFLRADYCTGHASKPDAGVDNDYIYTASDKTDDVAQYGGVLSQAAHKYIRDSYLSAPK